ncbi:MAG TPA: translation initiation factor IF-2 [Terriglobales bacterium]|nr:translation initiation factor IF-2 [Terriglobales bacterium]
MSKIRINDLARELEVKSKAILDVLEKVGVTEKKTHSSSLELDEAERVRQHFAGQGGGAKEERASRGEPEIKTKIDLSHISKPGDVLAALRKKAEAPAAPPASKPPIAVPPAAVPKSATPVAKAPAPAAHEPETPTPKIVRPAAPAPSAPPVPAAPVAAPPVGQPPVETRSQIETEERPETPTTSGPAAPPAATTPKPTTPPAVQVTPPTIPPPAAQTPAPGSIANASQQQRAQAPAPPARRIITPQTGPRPVYTAPPQPVRPSAPIGSRPGAPPQRPGGMPVRGQPIFQRRPAPGAAPGQRPGMAPGARRPMHPTRQTPGGRPMGMGAPGLAPPPPPGTRPAGRPGAPPRRPGQRYVPRGVKEGPMKGFNPPPRFSPQVSNEPLPITRSITITEGISVKDLAEKLDLRAKDLIARLLARGVFATVNQTLDAELAKDLARQFGADTDIISFEEQMSKDSEASISATDGLDSTAVTRPPVVTIMGHVDHGKTSLLDAIRETDVAGGEAGGITQHIGAYKVRITKEDSPAFGRQIVFLDTPGHEAFTRMRARGAKVTDIVVIVVAADDGVMPQTLEAIDHATAAKVPLIFAVNKIDKPGALPERVKKQLADRGFVPEEWGGKNVFVEVSAKQRTNLNLLMEMICLVADLQELKASPDRSASGAVLEAKLDRGRGAVATVLIQNGTLHTGETFIVGNTFGKVRAMFDDRGNAVDAAPPSTPVEILGLEGMPQAGDTFTVADREKAKNIATYREQKAREAALAKSSRVSLEGLAEQIKTAGVKELSIILKGDVQGSVEVLADSLQKMSNEQVKVRVLRSGVGAITESDVLLASASNAIIIGFNVRPERNAQELAEQENVEIRLHSIIYELQDEIRKAMTGLLEPVFKETYLGRAEVRETFRVPKVGTIAGCYVQDGVIKRDSEVRLLRDNVVTFKGRVGSLRRFKDDASEVRNGMECGIGIAGYGDIKVGDVIEAFSVQKVAAELVGAPRPQLVHQ